MRRQTCLALLLLLLPGCNAQIQSDPPDRDQGPPISPPWPADDPGSCSGCSEIKHGIGGEPFAPGSTESEFVVTDPQGALIVNKQGGGANHYLWVADTDLPGVVKIDLDTLKAVARYRTGGSSTSRTTVNSLGEAFIGARLDGATGKTGVTKVLPGGTSCPKKGGAVSTSTGVDSVLAWGKDDCVAWHTEAEGDIRGLAAQDVSGASQPGICDSFNGKKEFDPKSVATPEQHFLWIGGLHGKAYKLDAATGKILINTKAPTPVYGMALAGDGKLWMSNGSAFGFIDTTRCKDQASCDAAPVCTQNCTVGDCPATCDHAIKAAYNGIGGYGVTVDYKGRVWRSSNETKGPVMRYDPKAPANQRVALSSSAATTYGGGIAADGAGWVWAAYVGSHLTRFNAETLEGTTIPVSTKGVAVDTRGRVFAVEYQGVVHMIEPGKTINDNKVTKSVVPLKGIAYAYSDMTGVQTRLASGQPGWYRELFEPCNANGKVDWQYLTWDVEAPQGTWAMFNLRSADTLDALNKAPWYTVACVAPPGGKGFAKISAVRGQLMEVEVRFIATGDLNNPATVLSAKIKSFSVLHRCIDVQ